MEATNETSRPAILEKAWMHHAELDTNADRLSKRHLKLRQWVLILGIIATFLAIVTDIINTQCPQGINEASCTSIRAVLKVLLILTPLIGSMIAAFTSRELGDGRWLSMRAGAEEIKKEIYIYRTVLSHHPDRNKWLSHRLAYIQRQIFKASGRRLDTEPYKGILPLYYSPDNPNSDAGFNDLTAEEYITHRLQEQLSWHEGRIVRLSKAKRNLTIAILLAGVAGALLAALGGPFAVWVALTASLAASLAGWEELRNRDKTILNYSKVKLELAIIRDYWYSLTSEEQTDSEFYKMVLAAENVMFAQNGEWLRSMQEALAGAEDEDKKLVEEMVELSATSHAELQKKLLSESQAVFSQAAEQLSAVAADAAATVSGMVTAVSSEAMALNQTMAESVDAAAAEAAAARLALESSRDAALDEAAAWRETAQESATVVAAQSAAAREAAAAETAAWEETAQETMDTAVATSAAARQSVAETVDAAALEAEAARLALEASRDRALAEAAGVRAAAAVAAAAETAAWSETAHDVVDTAAAQSAAAREAARQSMAETADAVAAETEATRLALEASRDAALDEAAAWRETAQESATEAIAQSAAVRETAAAAATAETTAWSETAQEAVATAVASSAAARDAAAAEAAAWGETAQEALDTAVAEAAALREKAGEQIKFAVTFTPISEAIDEMGTAVQEKWTEAVYEAVPDVKYPVQFNLAAADGPENGEPIAPSDTAVSDTAVSDAAPSDTAPSDAAATDAAATDAAVDDAVNRLLEKGVLVADDTIKQALAKATQEEEN